MGKLGLFLGYKDSSIYANQPRWHTILTNGKIKTMIISIDAGKAFDKIQHPFMIKTLQKMCTEGTYLTIVKVIYEANSKHYSQWWETESIPPVSTFNTIIQHSSGSLNFSDQRRKRNKRNPDWKRRKLSLFADDMMLYTENPKDSIRKLLELISEFSKVAGYKINTQKSLPFLYTNNEKSEEKLRNQSHSPLPKKELNI